MNPTPLKLATCPIVEAVVDIRCDMAPSFKLEALETAAREKFRSAYPKYQKTFVDEHRLEQTGGQPPKVSARRDLRALQFLAENQRQLVQIRLEGYSFNRLTPYSTLDDYLPEIERSWKLFVEVASPVQVREIHLRYINRLLLPLVEDHLEFNDYLRVGPRLPDEETLDLTGFLDQHSAVERGTGHRLNLILTMQRGSEANRIPVILDIEAISAERFDPSNWESILEKIQALRGLKNRAFKNTLTDQCLSLYSH